MVRVMPGYIEADALILRISEWRDIVEERAKKKGYYMAQALNNLIAQTLSDTISKIKCEPLPTLRLFDTQSGKGAHGQMKLLCCL